MMKDDELWLKKIKERLDDYSEPLPDAGWERLEKALPTSAPMSVVGTKKKILFRRWAMTAAAVALVAVSSVSLWLLQSPVVDDVRRAAEPALAAIPDALPAPAEPDVQGEEPEFVIRRVIEQESSRQALVAQHLETEKNISEMGAQIQEKDTEVLTEKVNGDDVVPSNSSSTSKGKEREVYRPSSRDKLHIPAEKASSQKGTWSMGLSVGNSGGASTELGSGIPSYMSRVSMVSVSNGLLSIPNDQQLVFEDGVPYLRQANQVVDMEHHQPISFGLSVRKSLAKGFSVETGLTYTLLSSDAKFADSDQKTKQKLHYLGIPLKANWNFLDKKLFTLYVSGGGMIEKCVYGKLGTEKETVKPLQFSVSGAVGAQFNATKRVGIYVEPGVAYFFDDGSDVQTIRKENPFNFNIQAGIRLTY